MPNVGDDREKEIYERGRRDAEVAATLVRVRDRLDVMETNHDRLAKIVERLVSHQEQREAVQTALAKAVEKAANSAITARQFYVALGAAFIMFAALVISALTLVVGR